MITVSETVESLIEQSPFLLEAMEDGIINASALARKLKPQVERRLNKTIKAGAIVMAINRMSIVNASPRTHRSITEMVQGLGDIVVRSDLSDFTFANSPTLLDREMELLNYIRAENNLFCTFSQGIYETTIVVSSAVHDKVELLFKNEKLLGSLANLCSITIKLPEGNTAVSGIYYYILKQIAWAGVSIVEVISTTHEFTLVLQESEVNHVFTMLMHMKS